MGICGVFCMSWGQGEGKAHREYVGKRHAAAFILWIKLVICRCLLSKLMMPYVSICLHHAKELRMHPAVLCLR